MLGVSQSDEDCTQHGEYVGLNEGHEEFETVHEYHQCEADDGQRSADDGTELARDEDDASEGKDDGMTAHDVGKETYHEGERLGEDAEHFDDGHHGHGHFEPCGNGRPKDFFPIFLVAEEVHEKERTEGEEEGDVDVARDVCASGEDGDEPQEIRDKDEEEGGEEEWRVATIVLLADRGSDEVVVDAHNEHLHEAYEAFGRFARRFTSAVPTCGTYEYEGHEDNDNPYLHHVLRNAEIPGAHIFAVCQMLVDFPILCFVEIEAMIGTVGAFVEACGTEHLPSAFLPFHDDGKGYGDVVSVPRGDMPLIGVAHVAEHDFLHVDGRLSFLCGCSRNGKGECGEEKYECRNA